MTLIESDARKCAFLHEAARAMGLTVAIVNARIEEAAPQVADVVTARACASLSALLPLAARHLAPDGRCLFLKGQDVDRELTAAAKCWIFSVEKRPSLTDPKAAVLTLGSLRHV